MTAYVLAPLVLTLIWILFFRMLRSADYPVPMSLAVAFVCIAQAGLWVSPLSAAGGLWFALAMALAASSALAFAERQDDARAIFALGGSLAAIQLADPSGDIVAALALPMLAGLPRARFSRNAGLLLVLLFIPCLTAIGMAWFTTQTHFNFAQWLARNSQISAASGFVESRSRASWVLFLAPLLPAIVPVAAEFRSRRSWSVLALVLSVVLASFATVLLQISRSPVIFMAALAPAIPASLAVWRPEDRRTLRVLLPPIASTVLSWIVVLAEFVPSVR